MTGIDITENMIARARENVAAENANAELMVMDCQELSFPDNTFDLVICRNITWTLADPKKAYHEWKRVLKPGGRIMVFDACWYLQLFDEELKAKYIANEEKVNEQFEMPKRGHVDPQRGDAIGNIAFMGNKHRLHGIWDILLKWDFAKYFQNRTLWIVPVGVNARSYFTNIHQDLWLVLKNKMLGPYDPDYEFMAHKKRK